MGPTIQLLKDALSGRKSWYGFVWVLGLVLVVTLYMREPEMRLQLDYTVSTKRFARPCRLLWCDGDSVHFTDYDEAQARVLSMALATGEVGPLRVPGGSQGPQPFTAAIAADGESIAAAYGAGESFGVMVWRRGEPNRSSSTRLHVPARDVLEIVWMNTPRGNAPGQLAVIHRDDGQVALTLLEVHDQFDRIQVSDPGKARLLLSHLMSPEWSHLLASSDAEAAVSAVSHPQGRPELLLCLGAETPEARPSATGGEIPEPVLYHFFLGDRTEGRAPQPVRIAEGYQPQCPCWTPDGKCIVFHGGWKGPDSKSKWKNDLYRVELASPDACPQGLVVTSNGSRYPVPLPSAFSWSDCPSAVVFVSRMNTGGNVWVKPVDSPASRMPRQLTHRLDVVGPPAVHWAQDYVWIAVVCRTEYRRTWRRKVEYEVRALQFGTADVSDLVRDSL